MNVVGGITVGTRTRHVSVKPADRRYSVLGRPGVRDVQLSPPLREMPAAR